MGKTLFAFLAGAVVGAAGAYIYAKKKYEDQIESVKKSYADRYDFSDVIEENPNPKKPETTPEPNEKPDILAYAAKLRDESYTNYSSSDRKPESTPGDRPYVISPNEFGEMDDYTTISLMYYADQIVADDNDDIVDNVEEIIGFDSLNHFGEYEDDSVFVRNDARKCDYEILRSLRRYSEILAEKPYKRRD